jgi:hypothetical protein
MQGAEQIAGNLTADVLSRNVCLQAMGVADIRIFDAIPQFGDFRNSYS